MRRRRFELAAWEVYECGKPWREADADVGEAIDFCEYYAAGAIALAAAARRRRARRGEPLRVSCRAAWRSSSRPGIFRWPFSRGMTTAALVTGNTVVMKPAEQSSVIGAKLMEIFQRGRAAAGRASTICPATAKTSAPRWSSIPTWR